jgi:hypothetical protein
MMSVSRPLAMDARRSAMTYKELDFELNNNGTGTEYESSDDAESFIYSTSEDEKPPFADTSDEDSERVVMKTAADIKDKVTYGHGGLEFVVLKELEHVVHPLSRYGSTSTFRVNKRVRFLTLYI